MTRLRTDQACLDAQVRSQVAQQLTAELAVPCPDCGVEAGRSCRDSFDRAVRPHLDRAVAASSKRDTERCPGPLPTEDYARTVECPFCKAPPGAPCSNTLDRSIIYGAAHKMRLEAADKTPTAPERAPAIAPEAVPFHGPSIAEMLPRPTCACGQTIWNELTVCGDCRAENVSALLCMPQPAPLDQRIAETNSDDATECAWSTPTSDGEGWR